VAKTQQDVIIYKEKSFSTAQSQFEKDLKNQQREGWRLVSVTPTKKRGFGRIVELTAIYEKDMADDNGTTAATRSQEKAQEQARIAEEKDKTKAERRAKFQETQRLAREKEEAYRASLSPEQLQQYLKRKRRKTLIIVTIIVVSLVLCTVAMVNNPVMQEIYNAALTPIPTDTPVPPTPTPNLSTEAGLVAYTKNVLSGVTLSGSITSVTAEGEVLHVTEYIDGNGVWDNSAAKTDVQDDSFTIQKAIWTDSKLKPNVSVVYVDIQSDLTDAYGNTSKGDIGRANLMADTAAKFNWNNLSAQDAWNNQDYNSQWMLPSLNS
jgi:hypothetical protein